MLNSRNYALFLAFALAVTLFLGVLLLPNIAEANLTADITVNSIDDDTGVNDNCTLREAIQAANTDLAVDACTAGSGADTIAFDLPANITITLNGSQLPMITDTLTINGSTATNLTLSGNNASRVFAIGSSTTVTMTHLALVNGFVSRGGGIYNNGALVLLQIMFSGNSADWDGGGIFNDEDSTLTVQNSTFSGNSATYRGGGIYNSGGTVTVQNSILKGNSATYRGGGIHNAYNGTMTLENSTLSGNSATYRGGGIFNYSTMTVQNSTLSGNSADEGGGIRNDYDSAMMVQNSTLSGNSATYYGGGIDNRGGMLTVQNSTFSGNSATYGGGGVDNNRGLLTLQNSTFSDNSADQGGGIHNFGMLTVQNSTLSDNSATKGAGIFNEKGAMTVHNSIIANSSGEDDCWNEETIASNVHNLIESGNCGAADTITDDPRLGPLQDNGGATHTHALLPGSPAIDAGNNNECPDEDQRAMPRPTGGSCDIGAFESQYIEYSVYLPLLQVAD